MNEKHGLYYHLLHGVWHGMKQRCYYKKNKYYEDYGGRGICVCDEWRNNFKKFYDWATKSGWKKGLYIDRINNNGNYEPENCRFVTPSESNKNRRPYSNSGVKYVYFNKVHKLYQVLKNIDGKKNHFGNFKTLQEAEQKTMELV